MPDLRTSIRATRAFLASGADLIRRAGATYLRTSHKPRVWDANCVIAIDARDARGMEKVFAESEVQFGSLEHRRFVCDPLTPPIVEAELLLRGYSVEAEIQHVLCDLSIVYAHALEVSIGTAQPDAETLVTMMREELEERGAKEWLEDDFPRELSDFHHRKPGLETHVVRWRGDDAGHVSIWLGPPGYGKVEYLFVRRSFRGRGLSRFLLAHSVAQLAARGVTRALIGSRADDWPRHYYSRLGFQVAFVKRVYTLRTG